MVGCGMQMALVMSMQFIFGDDIELTCHVNHFFDLWQ